MHMRRASSEDAAAIHELLGQTDGDATIAPVEPTLDDVESFLGSDNAGAFIAELEGREVGAALFSRQGDVIWLFQIAVIPRARAQGVGKALVGAVEASARGEGASAVFVQIPKHLEARSFFETLGYQADIEEDDVVAGQPVTLVDLVKLV
jgi:N-acetylglutamate synthase-like GNAT family acetyltransferase